METVHVIVRFSYAALAASQRKQVEVRKQVGVFRQMPKHQKSRNNRVFGPEMTVVKYTFFDLTSPP